MKIIRRYMPTTKKLRIAAVKLCISIVVTTTLLTACGGGSDAAPGPSSPAAILGYLDSSNLSSAGFPWSYGVYQNVAKRWNVTTAKIPVKINGESRAGPAMDAIETKLGMIIFDRLSIASTADGSITRGIIFSQGTAYMPPGATDPQHWCANVSDGPNQPGYPANFMIAPGEISARLYVNLDNPGYCTASADVVIHELGHALGLGAHFQGFGNGPPISDDFWRVLATLYKNPIGTPTANIVVQ